MDIWAADCETPPFGSPYWQKLIDNEISLKDFPWIWGMWNGSEYHQFYDTDEFVDFCEKLENVIIYAHNGGKFDWHFIIHRLEAFSPLMIINGRLSKFTIGGAEFRDSYNILPTKLATFSKEDFDYSILEPGEREKPHNRIKIEHYLKSDCVNLLSVVTDFISKYGNSLTLAGAAMKTWERISGEKAPQTSKLFYDFMSPYYYGGRVECFQKGIIKTNFNVVDINSAYPFAMKKRHAYGTHYSISTALPISVAYVQRSFITVRCLSDGAFPYRTKDGLCFPADDCYRDYRVSGWEFLAAIDTNTIHDWNILECITFSESIEFNDYVDHFYEIKSNAKKNSNDYIYSKLFLNCPYGKFGANPENYNEFEVVPPRFITAAENDGFGFTALLGPWALCQKPLEEHKAHYYNVATAASITGFVRAMLWRAINQCEGVIYCDTDSIAAENTGALRINKSDLGAWDIEAECDFAAVAGKKVYAFRTLSNKWKTASKGVRLSAEEVCRVASGEEIKYTPKSPSFSLKRGINLISRKIKKN